MVFGNYKKIPTKKDKPLQLLRDVALLSALYRFYSECSGELFNLIPLYPFLHISNNNKKLRTGGTSLCHTFDIWNSIPTCVFLLSFDTGSFKWQKR